MRFGSFRYLVKQGWKNMGANRLMTFAGIGVLTACFIITGVVTLLTLNLNEVVGYLGDQNEITVFLLMEVDDEAAAAMEADIRALPNVGEVSFESKQDAYESMKKMLGSEGERLLEGIGLIFPAQYKVQVADLNFLEETNQRLMALPGVDYTSAQTDLAEVILIIRNAVTWFGWGLVAILALVSIIIISNTIRLTVFARRREISIMKYVGATNAFIRLPFFVEGMTVGIVAGLLSAGVICGVYYLVYAFLQDMSNVWVLGIMSRVIRLEDVWALVLGIAVGAGALLGGLGTASSVRKHLKV